MQPSDTVRGRVESERRRAFGLGPRDQPAEQVVVERRNLALRIRLLDELAEGVVLIAP